MADPFEEFEFKPLTEGLGFHKKADKIKADIRSSDLGTERMSRAIPQVPPRSLLFGDDAQADDIGDRRNDRRENRSASQSISELMASLPPSLDFLDEKPDLTRGAAHQAAKPSLSQLSATDRQDLYQPPTLSNVLPTPGTRAGSVLSSTLAMTPTAPAIQAPLVRPSPYREKLNEGYARAFPQVEKLKATATEAESENLQPVPANLAAGAIDAMVTAGISTIFLVCILTITKINLIGMLTDAHPFGALRISCHANVHAGLARVLWRITR